MKLFQTIIFIFITNVASYGYADDTFNNEIIALLNRDTSLEVTLFPISGDTPDQIIAALLNNGPKDQFKKSRFAYTKWNISWTWPQHKDGPPAFEEATADIILKVTLPTLIDLEKKSPQFQEKWKKFIRSIAHHERGHIALALAQYQRTAEAIRKAALEGKVKTKEDANRIGQLVLKDIRAFDLTYDAMSEHGKVQGVEFGK